MKVLSVCGTTFYVVIFLIISEVSCVPHERTIRDVEIETVAGDPECKINSDCSTEKSCINNKCEDPCKILCEPNDECEVIKHSPKCTPKSLEGDISQCNISLDCSDKEFCFNQKCSDPCKDPDICGKNAECIVKKHAPLCTCLPNHTGDPFIQCTKLLLLPDEKTKCSSSSECSANEKCVDKICIDPCVDTCGKNAECQVINNEPLCICLKDFKGNPFTECIKDETKMSDESSKSDCVLSSECPNKERCVNQKCIDPCVGVCGVNATCYAINHSPICSCPTSYTGDPFIQCNFLGDNPSKPECTANSECSTNRRCVNNKCEDSCVGLCEPNVQCKVVNHIPVCILDDPQNDSPVDPCNPSPCGPNAICEEKSGFGHCSCPAEYSGDPHIGCKLACTINSDCPFEKACIDKKCADPCAQRFCMKNDECKVIKHTPICTFSALNEPQSDSPHNPCHPSPCGPNSLCKVSDGNAVCTCLENFVGTPPVCRLKCIMNSDCSEDNACVNQKCTDPCKDPDICGKNAECIVKKYTPMCTCLPDHTGNPFIQCLPYQSPNPSERPECVLNAECQLKQACINKKCSDPCPGVCGLDASCEVINHNPICSCPSGYTGDAFIECYKAYDTTREYCKPGPCGDNAVCGVKNGVESCTCKPEYFGNPYNGCKSECAADSECSSKEMCVNKKCTDPCNGLCGEFSRCFVINHKPICSCPPKFSGDPFVKCVFVEEQSSEETNPCKPSPCGYHSICRVLDNQPKCSCLDGAIGDPPNCRKTCALTSDCSSQEVCINQKCFDPCENYCGVQAKCNIENNNAICSCDVGFTGDPFVRCVGIPGFNHTEIYQSYH